MPFIFDKKPTLLKINVFIVYIRVNIFIYIITCLMTVIEQDMTMCEMLWPLKGKNARKTQFFLLHNVPSDHTNLYKFLFLFLMHQKCSQSDPHTPHR